MFSMGVQLKPSDFEAVFKRPLPVFMGLLLQYVIMPLSGYAVASFFHLSNDYATGLILVACCPGGTASNVINYLARADVALSVTMTALSTFMAILFTPLLTAFYAGSRVDVPAMGLFLSTLQVVLLPILAGLVFHKPLLRFESVLSKLFPAIAVILISFIVASIVGASKKQILENGFTLPLAVIALHASGFLFGYIFAFWVSKSAIVSRTISVEVGMQNSGLGVVLARQNFTSPLTAIPSAISSLVHSLIGSALAAYWSKKKQA